MIEELERYARESKVDDLFRDMMTGCFRTRPNAPVRFVLEYLANEYPEESLAHARAYVDLREGVRSEKTCETSRKDARETVVVVEEPPREEETREEEDVEKTDVEDPEPKTPTEDDARRAAPATADEDDGAVVEPAMKPCESVRDECATEDESESKLVDEDEKVSREAPTESAPSEDATDES